MGNGAKYCICEIEKMYGMQNSTMCVHDYTDVFCVHWVYKNQIPNCVPM